MSRRVLVDDRCLYNRGGGIRTYLQQIWAHWPANSDIQLKGFRQSWITSQSRDMAPPASSENPLRLRPLRRLLESSTAGIDRPSDRGAGRGMLFRGYRAAFALRSRLGRYDATFDPNHLPARTAAPVVATIHDLSVLEHPEWHPESRVARWRSYLPEAVRHTSRWITVSEFTKRRMVELLGIHAARITVIAEAARPISSDVAGELNHLRQTSALPTQYFLFVGTLEPRKNLRMLLDAFSRLPREVRRAVPLVLAGPAGWGGTEFWSSLLEHPIADEVLVTGYLPDRTIAALISGAQALVMPSLYEGFGLPVIEAMAAGCPVICSDIEPFREVAGEAGLRVDCTNPDAWTHALQRAGEDPDWRAAQAREGIARASAYSWAHAAREHAKVLSDAIAGK